MLAKTCITLRNDVQQMAKGDSGVGVVIGNRSLNHSIGFVTSGLGPRFYSATVSASCWKVLSVMCSPLTQKSNHVLEY